VTKLLVFCEGFVSMFFYFERLSDLTFRSFILINLLVVFSQKIIF
jgi:hypothetical protein